MSPWHDNRIRRRLRWLSASAIFAFMPKCLICLGAYAGVGAWLGIKVGPEICGASGGISNIPYLWLSFLGILILTTLTLVPRSKPARGRLRSPACANHSPPACLER